jgi:protocatechuate 3,4-dioxygenase beta subunit
MTLGFVQLTPAQTPAPPAPRTQTGARPGLPPRDNPTAPTGTARISGRVFAADTSAGLRRAQVTITAGEMNIRRFVTTDAEGRYEFAELPAARYTIGASKGGYVSLQYGQQRPFEPGRPIALANGQELTQIDIALPRGSVITGRITDEFGEPIANAGVQVQRYQYGPGGQRRLTFAGQNAFASTDDLGQFRAFGLMPGEYVISANARAGFALAQGASGANDTNEGYPPTYYPGTTNPAEAQTITVGLGDELSIQLTLMAVRMARISGTVVDSEGKPVSGAMLTLRSASGGGVMTMTAGQSGSDGSFTLMNVPPGEHHVDVRPTIRTPDAPPEFGSVPIVVGSDNITGLRIATGRGATISGRVTFEGTADRTGSATPPRVTVLPVEPQAMPPLPLGGDPMSNGLIAADGSFQLRGTSGTVVFRVVTPPAWTLKSVILDGENITDVPYELKASENVDGLRIVLTDRVTDISGGVSNSRGQSLKDYVVVIHPATAVTGNAATRFTSIARPDQDGRFRVRRMPPGEYLATAIEALEQGREWDPEYQPKLREAGKAFSVKEGESIVLDLKLADGL